MPYERRRSSDLSVAWIKGTKKGWLSSKMYKTVVFLRFTLFGFLRGGGQRIPHAIYL